MNILVGTDGKPLTTEGRSIKITESTIQGKKMWGVDFEPGIEAFEFEEVIMILSDVTRGISQQALSRVREAKAMQAVAAKIQEMNK